MKIFGWKWVKESDWVRKDEADARYKKVILDAKDLNGRLVRDYRERINNCEARNEILEQKLSELEMNYKNVCFYHHELNEKYKKLREGRA